MIELWQLGRTALAILGAVVLWRFRINSAWLVLLGALAGLIAFR